MSTKITLYILIVAFLGSLGLLGKVGYDKYDLQSTNNKLNNELMQANLELGRARTEFGNAEKYISKLQSQIQSEIEERNATITRYGELKLKYQVLKKKKGKGVRTLYKDKIIHVPIDLKLDQGMYYEAISSSVLGPIQNIVGNYQDSSLSLRVDIFPAPGGARWEWDYKLDMRFELQLAETYLPSGGVNHYATMWSIDKDGNKIDKVEVISFKVIINKPNKGRWFWWAPKIDIGGIGGVILPIPDIVLGGSVGFSSFGYGITINDLSWRFLRVSFDFSSNIFGPGISPVVYNIGSFVPLISDLWIGPHITYIPPEGYTLSLFLGTVL